MLSKFTSKESRNYFGNFNLLFIKKFTLITKVIELTL